jgi:uncharacterized membrane protein YciS (DUF1049 family)
VEPIYGIIMAAFVFAAFYFRMRWQRAKAEVARLKELNEGLIERCAKQSDQLGRNAEKTVTFRRVEPMKPMPYPEQE